MAGLRALVACGVAALLVSGCGSTPVADEIGQREANQIVSILQERGITSQLVAARGSKGRYSVTVPNSRYPEAAGILTQAGLPADKKSSFQELTASHGIIPASREVEALRMDRAVAAEIEDILRVRPEVASVSVLVRARALDSKAAPTATVVIQKRPGATVEIDAVQQITTRAVPGMNAQDVFVSVVDSNTTEKSKATPAPSRAGSQELVSFLGISQVPASEYDNHVFLFIALSVFVGALAGLSGYLLGQFTLINRQGGIDAPRGAVRNDGGASAASDASGSGYDKPGGGT